RHAPTLQNRIRPQSHSENQSSGFHHIVGLQGWTGQLLGTDSTRRPWLREKCRLERSRRLLRFRCRIGLASWGFDELHFESCVPRCKRPRRREVSSSQLLPELPLAGYFISP